MKLVSDARRSSPTERGCVPVASGSRPREEMPVSRLDRRAIHDEMPRAPCGFYSLLLLFTDMLF